MSAGLEAMRAAVEQFIGDCREPRLLEPGQPLLVVDPQHVQLSIHGKWLQLECWDGTQFLSRRITAIRADSKHRLELTIERFGKRMGVVTLFDAARPSNQTLRGRSHRQVFAEFFRAILRRQFPGWNIAELSSEPSLQHSLSHAYPRAFLKQGLHGWAALAASSDSDVDGALTFGLIWLDYLRRREPSLAVHGLALFLPAGRELVTCLRMRCLDPAAAQWLAFVYTADGHAAPIDLADFGNLDTSIAPPAADPASTAFEPEALLERQVRAEIQQIDAALLASPVYGQVPSFAGGDRGILDLLACDHRGRLAVVELKAAESVQLPLQSLDYWMRVRWHAERGDFTRYGYFPSVPLALQPPRLLLVAPAIQFHPANETVVRFFDPAIEVERIGVSSLFAGSLKVLFRHRRSSL